MEASARAASRIGTSRASVRYRGARAPSVLSQWSISPIRPWSSTTGSPSPPSSQRKFGCSAFIVASCQSALGSPCGADVDALARETKEPDQGAKLDAEMTGHLVGGPGPGDLGPRLAGRDGRPEGDAVAACEARDGAAQVPDVVRVAAGGHRQHPLEIADRGPGV